MHPAQTVMLSVAAIVKDGVALLVDKQGRRIARATPLTEIGSLTDSGLLFCEWRNALRDMAHGLEGRTSRRTVHPWMKRAGNLAVSFRLRGYDRSQGSGRRMFDRYATHTWREAAQRLVMQGVNRFRVRNRSRWERWAYTVSNNQQKRADGHEHQKNHQREADHGSRQASALQVCDQRSDADT